MVIASRNVSMFTSLTQHELKLAGDPSLAWKNYRKWLIKKSVVHKAASELFKTFVLYEIIIHCANMDEIWNQLLALVIVVSTCILGAFIAARCSCCCCWCCICKLSIDAFIIGVIWIWLSSWPRPAVVDCCPSIALGSMSDICEFKMFVIEKLLLWEAPLPPKPMFAFICCWFIIPDVAVVDGMFWIWFDIGCANGWILPAPECSPDRSIFEQVEFLTCGGWLWEPVVLIIRPWAVIQRARHVVKRYDRLRD